MDEIRVIPTSIGEIGAMYEKNKKDPIFNGASYTK